MVNPGQCLALHVAGNQPPRCSRMVIVTDPYSVAAGYWAASQWWHRRGTSSSGFAVHHQQMNRALLSSASAPSMESRWNAFTGTVLPSTQTGASDSTAETAMKLRFAGTDEA